MWTSYFMSHTWAFIPFFLSSYVAFPPSPPREFTHWSKLCSSVIISMELFLALLGQLNCFLPVPQGTLVLNNNRWKLSTYYRQGTVLRTFTRLNPCLIFTTLWGQYYYYYPHFPNENTEAEEAECFDWGHLATEWQTQESDTGSLAPGHSLLTTPPYHHRDWGSWDQAGRESRAQPHQRGSPRQGQIKIASHQTGKISRAKNWGGRQAKQTRGETLQVLQTKGEVQRSEA